MRVLLDVDGVLNAVPGMTDDWDDWQQGQATGFRITWSPTVVSFIRRLAETPGVEVAWLSTWAELANKHLCSLLDLPQCLVAGAPPWREEHGWWKLDVARRLWDQTQTPFVWIDDDLGDGYDGGAAAWIGSLNGDGIGIRPDLRRGLTPRLINAIEEFVESWNGTEEVG
jgi:hypothetical protein